MAYLRESFAYAGQVLRTMTPANALETAGGPYGGTSTRLGLTTLAVWHASDHYGQLAVYLRMNGVVPPASQPAAVEPAARRATVFKDGGAFGTVTRVSCRSAISSRASSRRTFHRSGSPQDSPFNCDAATITFNVLLGKRIGDVPLGEWVAFRSVQGAFTIARNFANAAETSKCMAGDSLFVSQRQ